jgi:phage terminase large subunit GpA-like protein
VKVQFYSPCPACHEAQQLRMDVDLCTAELDREIRREAASHSPTCAAAYADQEAAGR